MFIRQPFTSLVLALLVVCSHADGGEFALRLDHSQPLPNITIDQQPARIHTQGLWIDDLHIYVTGRLESKPKRPVFVRLKRADPNQYAILDLSLQGHPALDHPGGFDFDGTHFWIPIARSAPAGPSVIVRISLESDIPFRQWRSSKAFTVDDHVGAIAYQRQLQQLYGANWDTQQVHVWDTDGTKIATIPRPTWIKGDASWALAIQDWKSVSDGFPFKVPMLIAGGIDKSPQSKPAASQGVIDVYDVVNRRQLVSMHVPAVEGHSGPLTHEGLCLYDGKVVLLPGDLGRDARLYFFRLVSSN